MSGDRVSKHTAKGSSLRLAELDDVEAGETVHQIDQPAPVHVQIIGLGCDAVIAGVAAVEAMGQSVKSGGPVVL